MVVYSREEAILNIQNVAQVFAQVRRIGKIANAQPHARRLVRIARPNAAFGGALRVLTARFFLQAVEQHVIRHHHLRPLRYVHAAGRSLHTGVIQQLHLCEN